MDCERLVRMVAADLMVDPLAHPVDHLPAGDQRCQVGLAGLAQLVELVELPLAQSQSHSP